MFCCTYVSSLLLAYVTISERFVQGEQDALRSVAPSASCFGSNCELLEPADCAQQGGHTIEGAAFCSGSLCATGSRCPMA